VLLAFTSKLKLSPENTTVLSSFEIFVLVKKIFKNFENSVVSTNVKSKLEALLANLRFRIFKITASAGSKYKQINK
jgi:hypothetical protein